MKRIARFQNAFSFVVVTCVHFLVPETLTLC